MMTEMILILAIVVETITTIKNIRKEKELSKAMNMMLECQKEDIVISSDLVEKHNKTIQNANEIIDMSRKLLEATTERCKED